MGRACREHGPESAGKQVALARLDADKVRYEIEQAEARKNILVKYTIPIRLKERRAAAELARSKAMMKKAEWSLANDVVARLEREATHFDALALTPAEHAAMDRFAALEKPWRAILARRDAIGKADPATRDELGKLLGDFAKALGEAEQRLVVRPRGPARRARRRDHGPGPARAVTRAARRPDFGRIRRVRTRHVE